MAQQRVRHDASRRAPVFPGVLSLFTIVCWCLVVSAPAFAQAHLIATSDQGRPGDTATVRLLLEYSGLYGLTGWSFGLCHDPDVANVVSVESGETTAALNGGSGPDFQQATFDGDGFGIGAVVSFVGSTSLPPGLDIDLYQVSYSLVGDVGDSTSFELCDTIGAPPLSVYFLSGDEYHVTTISSGSVEIQGLNRPTQFIAPYITIPFGTSEVLSVDATVQALDYEMFNLWFGVQLAIAFDTTKVLATNVVPAGPIAALDGGPGFFQYEMLEEGVVVGVVFDLIGGEPLQFLELSDMATITFETNGPVNPQGALVPLEWADLLGDSPPTATVVVGSGASLRTVHRDGLLRFQHPPSDEFLRGDCDSDGTMAIGDPIEVLQHLFGGLDVPCLDACDYNGDGDLDLVDPIGLLGYLFLGGDAPVAPFPSCAEGPAPIGCETYSCP